MGAPLPPCGGPPPDRRRAGGCGRVPWWSRWPRGLVVWSTRSLGGRVMDRSLERPVVVEAGPVKLEGDLSVPEGARGVVLFAHGSGSSRHSSRNRRVAGALQ